MTSPRLLALLTLVNLALLAHQALRVPYAEAGGEFAVLRGSGLEIVDEKGRLRAELKVEAADSTYRWRDSDRVGYPETVIFRLITADGKPRVKVTTSDEGSGLMLLGDSDMTQTTLHAERTKASLRLRNDPKTERVLAP